MCERANPMAHHIGFVITSFGGGGAERSAITTALAWSPPGEAVIVVANGKGPYRDETIRRARVDDLGQSAVARNFVRFAWALRGAVRRHNLRVLVVNGFGINHLVLLARHLRLIPDIAVVVIERNQTSHKITNLKGNRLRQAAIAFLTCRIYRRADAIVAVSDGVSRDLASLLAVDQRRIAVIYNPVDVLSIQAAIDAPVPTWLETQFLQLKSPVVISAGRLQPQKSYLDLVEAFAKLHPEIAGSLVILGDGPLRAEILERAAHLGLENQIWMPGFVDNPWWFISRSSVFALSSRWEGFARVLVEALACGVPVVSTDCPSGPREILKHVDTAQLVPVGDVSQLSSAIYLSLTSRRTSANPNLERFGPHFVAKQYQSVVDIAIGRHRVRRRQEPTALR